MMKYVKKILTYYTNSSVEVKAALWFTICRVLQKCISFITTPFFTRLLSTDDYGTVTLYNSWMNVISVVVTLNLFYGSYNVALVKFGEKKDRYTASISSLMMVLIVFFTGVSIIFREYIERIADIDYQLWTIMLIQIFFQSVVSLWMAKERFEYRYRNVVVVTIAYCIVSTLFSLVVVIYSEQRGLARIYSSAIFEIILGVILLITIYNKGRCFFERYYWYYAVKVNLPLIPHYLASVILGQSDRIMIEKIVGLSDAAIYSLAYSLSTAVSVVTSSINQAYTPWLYRRMKEEQCEKIPQIVDLLYELIAMILIVCMLLGPEIIKIMAPKDYYGAVYAIPPIMASVLFTFLYCIFANIEFYYEKSIFIMLASVISAVMNLVLNYIFIPKVGYIAAAYTTLVCYIVFSIIHIIFSVNLLKKSDLKIDFHFGRIIIVSLVFILCGAIVLFLYQNTILRYVVIIGLISIVLLVIKKRGIVDIVLTMKKE